MKRKIYDKLLEWKRISGGKTAVMLDGARRVGKSYIAEEFARNEYDAYLLIDFAKVSSKVKRYFNEYLEDLDTFFMYLLSAYNVDLPKGKSVIIFDEVQRFPKAREAIKYLVADGRYHYIETGSLISIKKNVQGILIPSEERKISMYPMDYEEFLWAIGDHTTTQLIRKCFEERKSVGEKLNRKLLRDFRLYMLVGGMPQAVNEYITTNNFRKVDLIKRDILSLYEEDFRKFDPSGKASKLFDAIPAQLNKNASKYQTTSVLKKPKTAKKKRILQFLIYYLIWLTVAC